MTDAAPGTPPFTVADYERLAADRLDRGAHSYYAGGAADELTLADNIAAWRRLRLVPRVLTGVAERDPAVTVLGRARPHPVIVAPVAFQRMAHPEGELAMARGAADAGAVMCLSTLATCTAEDVAAAAPDGTRWFQVYVFRDRGVTRDLVARAQAAGYEALVVTADLPIVGFRERELRDPASTAAVAAGATFAMAPSHHAELIDPDLRWSDIEQLAAASELPVLVKGILAPQDAVLAAEHGAAGIVVSNHGGRQLDTAVASADALPAVLEAAGDRLEVLVDGGIRRGTDILKALALGAGAVLVGRPALWGLAVDGSDGVRSVLAILLQEFDNALAQVGTRQARKLDRGLIAPPSGEQWR